MPPTTHLLAFTLTAFLLIAVPGPSVLFTVSRALALGRVAGVATVAGNTAGVCVQVMAVAFGIGALAERSVLVFNLIKLGGAGYLIFLGIQAIRHRRRLAEALGTRLENKSIARIVTDGFVVGLGNPKVIVFFAAVLPQFADRPELLFPYVEFAKQSRPALEGTALADASAELLCAHLARRPLRNPVAQWRAAFPAHLDMLLARGEPFFHPYSFNLMRQLGANFELLSKYLLWLCAQGFEIAPTIPAAAQCIASESIRASSSDAEGSFSEGLSTKVFPQAMARGNIHIGTMAGKLNGVIPATTPSGCRIE